MGLSVEVLRLYLSQANLTTSGSKKALVDRMLENGIFPSDMATDSGSGDEQGGIENEALPDNEEASSSGDPHSSGEESHSHAPTLSGRWWFPLGGPRRHALLRRLAPSARNDLAGATRLANDLGKKPIGTSESVIHGATAALHRRGPVPATGVIDERTAGPRDRVPLAARAAAAAAAALVHQQSPPSSRALLLRPSTSYIRRIRLGKFIKFDKLLPVHDELVFGGRERLGTDNKRQRPAKRQVHDLASWLEAWNIFLAVRVQSHPREALQLVKYQAIICHLFTAYSAAACLKYDSLFRQAAARDKSKLIAWDHLKEDILVWCATRQPFRPSKFQPAGQADSRVTGPPSTPSGRITHTSTGQEIVWGTSPGTLIPTALE